MNMKTIYYFFVLVLSLLFVSCGSDILVNEVVPPVKAEKKMLLKHGNNRLSSLRSILIR